MPHTGTVHLLGRELADWPRRDKARALSWLGQNEAAADDLTVYDVAMLGRLPHQPWLAPQCRRPRRSRASPARHPRVGLAPAHAGGLSGGERQRVLLARAPFTVQAQVLLMDEPWPTSTPTRPTGCCWCAPWWPKARRW